MLGFLIHRFPNKKMAFQPFNFKWWRKAESNRRHKDFQSFALPTELSSQKKWRSWRGSNSRSSPWQGDMLTTKPQNMVAWEGFEPTTSGLWARRATTALPRDIAMQDKLMNGGGRGIRTPAPVSRSTGFQDRTLQPLGYSSNNYGGPCRTWTHNRPVMSREL